MTDIFKNMKKVILNLTCLVLFKKLEAVHTNNMLRNFAKSDCEHLENRNHN